MLPYILWFLIISVATHGASYNQQVNWMYTVVSVVTASSDTSKLNLDIKLVTLGRNLYSLSGTCDFKVEINDNIYVQAKTYRSRSGSGSGLDYQLMPYVIDKQTISSFANDFYKKYLMKPLRDCSNTPQFEDTFTVPQPPKLFFFENCQVPSQSFRKKSVPIYILAGFYRAVLNLTSIGVQASAIVDIRVEN